MFDSSVESTSLCVDLQSFENDVGMVTSSPTYHDSIIAVCNNVGETAFLGRNQKS